MSKIPEGLDPIAKSFALLGIYEGRFRDAGIPQELWYPTEDMQCRNVIHEHADRHTGEIIETRCLQLLRDHPKTPEYLSAHGYQYYDAESGQMVGVKQAKFCTCTELIQQKQLIDKYDTIRRYKDANLPQVVRGTIPRSSLNATLENFDVRPGTEAGYEAAGDYTVGNTPPILMFIGGTGTGKTHLLEAIARQYLRQEKDNGAPYTVRYELVSNMLRLMRNSFRANAEDTVLSHVYNSDLLLLDDIGAEKPSEWVEQELFNIIEDRYKNNKLLVLASNEVEPVIRSKLGDRIASRLFDTETGGVQQVYITSTDYRTSS